MARTVVNFYFNLKRNEILVNLVSIRENSPQIFLQYIVKNRLNLSVQENFHVLLQRLNHNFSRYKPSEHMYS